MPKLPTALAFGESTAVLDVDKYELYLNFAAERESDPQEAQLGDRTHGERPPRPPGVAAGMVLVALHEVGDEGGNVEQPGHGNSSRMDSTSA